VLSAVSFPSFMFVIRARDANELPALAVLSDLDDPTPGGEPLAWLTSFPYVPPDTAIPLRIRELRVTGTEELDVKLGRCGY